MNLFTFLGYNKQLGIFTQILLPNYPCLNKFINLAICNYNLY